MYPRYDREERDCPPIHWYWNGVHWACNHHPVSHYWSNNDWDRIAEQDYRNVVLRDYGPNPLVIELDDATEQNNNFRSALWTGSRLQLVLMSLRRGEEIGLEQHANTDQFIKIEEGQGLLKMGNSPSALTIEQRVSDDDAIIIPAGTWHNLINTGNRPLKLYTIYAPPEHAYGTVQQTRD